MYETDAARAYNWGTKEGPPLPGEEALHGYGHLSTLSMNAHLPTLEIRVWS